MKTDQSPNRNSVPVAFWAVVVLVIICVGAAMFLVPGEDLVMKRLTADGKIQRLREIVAGKIGREPSDHDLLEHAVAELGKNGWDETGTQAVEQLAANVENIEGGFAAIADLGEEIPAGSAGSIYSKMARRALAENKPQLAAKIFQRIADLSGMSEDLTTEIVTSLRASSEPAEALAALKEFKQDNGGELPESLNQLLGTLALEAEDHATAFQSAHERFERDREKSPEKLRAAIDRLITAGSHAGRTGELIPLCDEYLATTPAGKMTWLQIVEQRVDNPSFDDPEFTQIANEAAKFCRWNNQADKAFDYFRKLSALGSSDALQQCIELHKPLLRESEMVTLLDAFIPVDGRPEYTLLAAQIHAKRTDYAVADHLYRKHLSAHPDDAASWAELGGMWDAAAEFSLALDAYRNGANINPDDQTLQRRIGRTLISMGDFEAALEQYAGMQNYDRKILTHYLTLATNLGDNAAANDALRKWFTLPGERRTVDYLRLARSYGALGQRDNMIAVYMRGIKAFPKQREIKIELARELSRLRRHSDVMQVISSSGMRDDPEAVSLHLASALASKQYKSGISFSGSDAERRMELPISAKLPLAEIYYQTGSVAKSNALYNTIPESEMPTITRATIAHRRGKFGEAETLLRRHLASNSRDHRGWSFLASVYQAQRKKPQAQEAYQRALDLLKADLKRRNS